MELQWFVLDRIWRELSHLARTPGPEPGSLIAGAAAAAASQEASAARGMLLLELAGRLLCYAQRRGLSEGELGLHSWDAGAATLEEPGLVCLFADNVQTANGMQQVVRQVVDLQDQVRELSCWVRAAERAC